MVNNRYRELFNLGDRDVIGKTIFELIPSAEAEIAESRDKGALNGAVPHPRPYRHRHPDGSVADYEVTKFLIADHHGKPIGIGVMVMDVTASKRAEVTLRESERALSEAQRIALMGHWRYYPKTDFVEMSDEIYRIFGLSKDDQELSLVDLQRSINEDDLREMERVRTRALANKAPYSFSYRFRRLDGELRFMAGEAQPEYSEAGELVSIFGVTQDITDRHRIEIDLRNSRTQLADFADASADFYWQTDAQLHYTYLSPSVLSPSVDQHIPVKVSEAVGQPVAFSIAPAYTDMDPWQYIKRQMEAQQPFRDVVYQRQGSTADEIIWLRTSAKPYYDENGEFGGFRGTTTNITEHRALEEQLIQAQKMETVGQLTGGVAHDFNNLLAVILGNTEMLAEFLHHLEISNEDGIAAERFADTILRTAQRGAELTQQLLAFSRKQTLSPKVVQLDRQIDDMITILQRSLGATIQIETSRSADLWPCYIDPGQIENVMLNLALNARDAMPDGGTLSIETTNTDLNDDYAAAQADLKPGEYVTLSVTDTGTGMTPQVKSKVFEPFFTTKDQGNGTGLGLSMVFGFVKQSNGQVTIYSELGHGTTIKLYLPRFLEARRSLANPDGTEADKSVVPKARDEWILVVEDDPDVRTLTVALLASLGYQVLAAADAAAALDVMKRERHIDLLLTDVILPNGVSGNIIAEQAPQYHPNIKIIYMSGYTQDALIHQGRLAESVILLQKPFRKADLASKLRMAMDG
ncbi:MAG: PAS domain S-box protein [Rhodospirillaceae bacterium]|nr:PAS domain S-box protein [Rhodospirillaceae bacterium]MBT4691391.1 PAS domain S-box protein [Rhodospirillaceae bacterium]MBT6986332.1 PAS domain S-box protein [Rhodospirillaceae bacterium]MBT7287370.1 PAS domain S-box protein [Rhodospirillaceae bacterium]MBT7975451.1 PAS domain S-box protein [Rhodospirillaceae bacterium]